MKLAGEGGTPNWLVMLGELKSSISSLNRIPLTDDRTLAPKLQTSLVRPLYPPHLAPTHPLAGAPTCSHEARDSIEMGPQFPTMQGGMGPPLAHPGCWQLLLEVDGAGGRHGAAVLRDHGQVRGAAVIGRVELRLIVGGRVSGVVGDPGPKLGSKELRAHVADHLPRPQSRPEEVGAGVEGHRLGRAALGRLPTEALTTALLHPKPQGAR